MKIIKTLVILLFIGGVIGGCSSINEDESDANQTESNVSIYTTVYPLEYIVEEIGGETVTVHSVYPPGADGHTYEPTSKEMTEFAMSDAFIYIGEGMEAFAESISSALESQDVKLIEIGKHEDLFRKGGHEHEHNVDEEHPIEIEGLVDHYHTGDEIKLRVHYGEDVKHDHLHWFTLDEDSDEWEVVDGQTGDTYGGEAAVDDQQIKAVLYNEEHDIVGESHPVTIVIDDHSHEGNNDHHADHEHGESEVDIEGIAPHYHTGDEVKLRANHNDDAEDDHWDWFTRAEDSDEWEVVGGQTGDTYEGEATMDGQQIKAVLFNEEHDAVAESEVKVIRIDDHTEFDPHIWTDPIRVIEVAEIIKQELILLNPNEEDLYEENFALLKGNLLELDERFMTLLEKKENKHIIVPHAAFGYWEERYGVTQIAISGLSSEEEPSQKELIEVIEAAEKYDVEYILYEQNSESRLSTVIQEEIGAEALTIHNLEVRTDEDIANKEDYISLMNYNLQVLDQVTK